jgi:hypothetical protein
MLVVASGRTSLGVRSLPLLSDTPSRSPRLLLLVQGRLLNDKNNPVVYENFISYGSSSRKTKILVKAADYFALRIFAYPFDFAHLNCIYQCVWLAQKDDLLAPVHYII